jgi:hypothetical protein
MYDLYKRWRKFNEATDLSCMSQFVMLLWYVKCDSLIERFLSFAQVQNCMTENLAFVLKYKLACHKLGQKLIAEPYEDAAVYSRQKQWIQFKMKDIVPHAHFIHCYAYQSKLVMKHVLQWNK